MVLEFCLGSRRIYKSLVVQKQRVVKKTQSLWKATQNPITSGRRQTKSKHYQNTQRYNVLRSLEPPPPFIQPYGVII